MQISTGRNTTKEVGVSWRPDPTYLERETPCTRCGVVREGRPGTRCMDCKSVECPAGHLKTEENLWVSKDGKTQICKPCRNAAKREKRRREKSCN